MAGYKGVSCVESLVVSVGAEALGVVKWGMGGGGRKKKRFVKNSVKKSGQVMTVNCLILCDLSSPHCRRGGSPPEPCMDIGPPTVCVL